MVLSSSGMRIGECLQLKLSDLEDGDPYGIKINAKYSKSGNSRIIFINKETVLFLNEWLKVRQSHLYSENGKTRLHATKEDQRIFPYQIQTAYFM